jgi:hypothetical protein
MQMTDPLQITVGNQTLNSPLPVVDMAYADFDVLLGWPEVRDNILDFDSSTHVVRRLEALPAETAAWMKFKIHPGDLLELETPLPNGKIGILEVDTGFPAGVILPPAAWKAWIATHPHLLSQEHHYGVPFLFTVTHGETSTDELKVGPITFTNIAVGEAEWKAVSDTFVANLGVKSLDRMELIVDGPGGYAYVRPKPAGEASTQAPNWTLAPDVRISEDTLHGFAASVRAFTKWNAGDTAGALAEYTTALAFSPENFDMHFARGTALVGQGDFAGALADFDACAKLRPDDSDYAQLYGQVMRLRLGQPTADFAQAAAGLKDGWAKTAGQYLAGNLDEAALLAVAEKPGDEPATGQQCEAYYFIGAMRMAKGDPAGARDAFQKCLATGKKDYYEYQFAKAELARLDKDAKK